MTVQKHQMFLVKQINRKMDIMAKRVSVKLSGTSFTINTTKVFFPLCIFVLFFCLSRVFYGNNKVCKFLRARSIEITGCVEDIITNVEHMYLAMTTNADQ